MRWASRLIEIQYKDAKGQRSDAECERNQRARAKMQKGIANASMQRCIDPMPKCKNANNKMRQRARAQYASYHVCLSGVADCAWKALGVKVFSRNFVGGPPRNCVRSCVPHRDRWKHQQHDVKDVVKIEKEFQIYRPKCIFSTRKDFCSNNTKERMKTL